MGPMLFSARRTVADREAPGGLSVEYACAELPLSRPGAAEFKAVFAD